MGHRAGKLKKEKATNSMQQSFPPSMVSKGKSPPSPEPVPRYHLDPDVSNPGPPAIHINIILGLLRGLFHSGFPFVSVQQPNEQGTSTTSSLPGQLDPTLHRMNRIQSSVLPGFQIETFNYHGPFSP
ncbi:hypothetical protein L798_06689 [Zootermopsis nevadensis]|uniref:Uncharacterized protein n=1 Tax=Zootermopsis nevadensis TaxID=136037 RepID=A0A067QF39_ZOONE|nr:hypothetical protein L798_06689 [Zootermopsis nevadensis]